MHSGGALNEGNFENHHALLPATVVCALEWHSIKCQKSSTFWRASLFLRFRQQVKNINTYLGPKSALIKHINITFPHNTLYRRMADSNAVASFQPLHRAAKNGDIRAVLALVVAGANVNVVDTRGYTPLHLASFNGYVKTVRALFLFGADVNAADTGGYTPLHIAACQGRVRRYTRLRLLVSEPSTPRTYRSHRRRLLLPRQVGATECAM